MRKVTQVQFPVSFFSNGFEIGTSNTMSNKSGDTFIFTSPLPTSPSQIC